MKCSGATFSVCNDRLIHFLIQRIISCRGGRTFEFYMKFADVKFFLFPFSCRWLHYAPWKWWKSPTRNHGFTTQKTRVFINISVFVQINLLSAHTVSVNIPTAKCKIPLFYYVKGHSGCCIICDGNLWTMQYFDWF